MPSVTLSVVLLEMSEIYAFEMQLDKVMLEFSSNHIQIHICMLKKCEIKKNGSYYFQYFRIVNYKSFLKAETYVG